MMSTHPGNLSCPRIGSFDLVRMNFGTALFHLERILAGTAPKESKKINLLLVAVSETNKF